MIYKQHHNDDIDNHQSNQPAQPPEPQKVDFSQFFNNKVQQQPHAESVATNPLTEAHVVKNNNNDHMMHVGISHSNSDDENNTSSEGDHVSASTMCIHGNYQ